MDNYLDAPSFPKKSPEINFGAFLFFISQLLYDLNFSNHLKQLKKRRLNYSRRDKITGGLNHPCFSTNCLQFSNNFRRFGCLKNAAACYQNIRPGLK